MFNKDGFEQIGKDIYVRHNFISKEECEVIFNKLEEFPDTHWLEISKTGRTVAKNTIDEIKEIKLKIESILTENAVIGEGLSPQKLARGAFGNPHADNFMLLDIVEAAKKYNEGEEFDLVLNNAYGYVVYFNKFDGGELKYVEQDISYQPLPGDLVIHSAGEHCTHGIGEVLSNVRYCYANNISEYVKVPKGYFE